MSSYGMREKKIVFSDTGKRHADLKVRLQYDDLSQTDFFRAMLTGYIEKDERVISYVYEWREQNKKYSKRKRAKSERLLGKGEEIKNKFGLNQNEIEDIFDLLEEEHPDL
mgnify:FL=1|tara:strand:- start:175 stop:504 length:330 start_codon:yes stop_codon:yes gene_type:complete